MKIDRLTIANVLKAAKFSDENATAVATAIGDAIEDATKDMASLKDLELISAKSDARMESIARTQTIWIIGAIFTAVGLLAALKFFA
ncbi:hypothetical protein DUT91_24065 [Phyllobacterium salinisoli]|uniref:DUF1640 domain-containing protein n=1 Tax=Phyllobacterium salinisoli TaxID=1899321 RepID=A0A368JWW2_9HYPH|nr:hypothetical protein [Phyllobacterium salinisoli]RCS21441.1 hypothetical protein DUT91_24065 [Phyllobacterium salinisoli]